MDLDAIVQDIDAEISRLEKVRALLTDHTAPLKRGFPSLRIEGNGGAGPQAIRALGIFGNERDH
jgi:hypothetical protein